MSEAPDSPDAHRKMGLYYLQHGELPRAIVEFKRVLELQPNDQETRRFLTTALQMSGRSAEKQR